MTKACIYRSGLSLAFLWALGVSAGESPPSFARDIQPIFDGHCVQCHMLEGAQAGLVLEEGEAYKNLVGVPSTESKLCRVVAGAPDKSYLIHKLRGTQVEAGGAGLGMPLVENMQKPLEKQELDAITRWIELGAKDD